MAAGMAHPKAALVATSFLLLRRRTADDSHRLIRWSAANDRHSAPVEQAPAPETLFYPQ